MALELTSEKYTTREGTHEDDFIYLDQVKNEVLERLEKLGFIRTSINLVFTP